MKARVLSILPALAFVTTAACAAISVPGANGSDGTFNVVSATVDLSQAPTGVWDASSPVPGKGVYDPERWAVVFHYTNVSITGNVGFKNHATRAPVVWLVNGNVTITGNLYLDANGETPGPGGFRGTSGGGGFGPGGPNETPPLGNPASYGTPGTQGTAPGALYGNARILPLIGGSGGSLATTGNGYAGGAGGGAILIVATGTITINGAIVARGEGGASGRNPGSGGAIRLVADTVTGTGALSAVGGNPPIGGNGRIRIEALNRGSGLTITPVASGTSSVATAQIWPADEAATVRIVSVGNEIVPSDPKAAFNLSDVAPDVSSTLPVVIETRNVPTTATVNLRVVPVTGNATTVKAAFTSGDQSTARWTAQIVPVAGTTALQVRVETQ